MDGSEESVAGRRVKEVLVEDGYELLRDLSNPRSQSMIWEVGKGGIRYIAKAKEDKEGEEEKKNLKWTVCILDGNTIRETWGKEFIMPRLEENWLGIDGQGSWSCIVMKILGRELQETPENAGQIIKSYSKILEYTQKQGLDKLQQEVKHELHSDKSERGFKNTKGDLNGFMECYDKRWGYEYREYVVGNLLKDSEVECPFNNSRTLIGYDVPWRHFRELEDGRIGFIDFGEMRLNSVFIDIGHLFFHTWNPGVRRAILDALECNFRNFDERLQLLQIGVLEKCFGYVNHLCVCNEFGLKELSDLRLYEEGSRCLDLLQRDPSEVDHFLS